MSNTELKCFVTCSLHFLCLLNMLNLLRGTHNLSVDLPVLESASEFVGGRVVMSGQSVFCLGSQLSDLLGREWVV